MTTMIEDRKIRDFSIYRSNLEQFFCQIMRKYSQQKTINTDSSIKQSLVPLSPKDQQTLSSLSFISNN